MSHALFGTHAKKSLVRVILKLNWVSFVLSANTKHNGIF